MFEEVNAGWIEMDAGERVNVVERPKNMSPAAAAFASGPSFIVIEIVFCRVKWPEKSLVRQQTFKKIIIMTINIKKI